MPDLRAAYAAPDGQLYAGHVIDMLRALPEESVHCVISSPPYWGLRKYSGEQAQIWGGDPSCEHSWSEPTKQEGYQGRTRWQHSQDDGQARTRTLGGWGDVQKGVHCIRCQAYMGAYGLEPTPSLWLWSTILWLREVKRVLRSDGTVWLNVGSSYWGGKGQSGQGSPEYQAARYNISLNKPYDHIGGPGLTRPSDGKSNTFQPLDLIWLSALLYPMLLADGWYVRSVVVWAKPNPMPESVGSTRWERCRVKVKARRTIREPAKIALGEGRRDIPHEEKDYEWAECPGCPKCLRNDGLVLRKGSWRPTSSYEEILMLTKTQDYFGDGEAVREPAQYGYREMPQGDFHSHNDQRISGTTKGSNLSAGRNLRDVWEFPTQPYAGAHFATFPEALVEKCILASTPEHGVCAECGAPWARVIEHKAAGVFRQGGEANWAKNEYGRAGGFYEAESQTLGWRKTCSCETDWTGRVGATVLDPFVGSGTTVVVARRLSRYWVGIDISEDYILMAQKRLEAVALPLPL